MFWKNLAFFSICCVIAVLSLPTLAQEGDAKQAIVGSDEPKEQASDQSAQEAIEEAKETTNEAIEAAKQAILEAIERAKEIASSVIETDKEITQRALDKAKEFTRTLDSASKAAREVLDKARQATEEVLEKAKEAAQSTPEVAEKESSDAIKDGQAQLSDADVENLVERSYQYVTMYNVNNKFAAKQGGWNTCDPDTELKDHTMRDIARPNNDTLYIGCMLDLRKDPVILEIPAFDSKYVSLMVTAYDHYVNVPMTTRLGDFRKPEKILFYSARTEGYDGESVEGVDRIFEATGDFVSAVFRVMPHANETEKFQKILDRMKSVKLITLSEYQGDEAKPIDDIDFPPVGETDLDVFGNNLLEVMQFVFNHTTFDPNNAEDQAVLAAYEPLGAEPGKPYDQNQVAKIDGKRFRKAAEQVQRKWLANMDALDDLRPRIFQPKGETDLEAVLAMSVIGPIGLPREEAMYPPVATADGEAMNAMHDYVIRMTKDELPPAEAFWSVTLYDRDQGFFIPNDRKKYSVGENAGMKVNEDGGIEIYVAAEKPEGVPEENWLPIEREDLDLNPIIRIYVPDLEKMRGWQAPKAEKLSR
jgi:hypothetical protein